jgi:hypothetical protein
MSTALVFHPVEISRAAPIRRPSLFPFLYAALTLIGVLAGIETAPLILRLPRLSTGFTISEHNGQLLIARVPALFDSSAARLEIVDGNRTTSILLRRDVLEITYARQTPDVRVRLIEGVNESVLRFLAIAAVDQPAASPLLQVKSIQTVTAQAQNLRVATETRLRKVVELQRRANRLLRLTAPRPLARRQPAQNRPTTWFWR